MPQPNVPGGNPGFFQDVQQIHNEQTHASQLNGTADRGLFIPGIAVTVDAVHGEADTSVDWTVKHVVPTAVGTKEYTVYTRTGTTFIYNNDQSKLPRGAQLKVLTTAGTNPRVTIITRLLKENF